MGARIGLVCVLLTAFAFAVAGCGGSDAASGAAEPEEAVSGFVSAVQNGDGAAACAFLTEDEQALLVTNAKDVTPPVAGDSCEAVVESFHEAIGAKADELSGKLENLSDSGDFASADWVYTGGAGQQAVLLAKKDGNWLIAAAPNDFPTAILHWSDQG
jgi:ketosteroid isomerase-like protein